VQDKEEERGDGSEEVDLMAHADALYAYAMARLRDSVLAEEAVQETLLAALTARQSQSNNFQGQSALRTWLTGILKHKVVDLFRNQIHTVANDDLQGAFEQAQFDSNGHWRLKPGHWPTPEAAVEQREMGVALSRCIGALANPAASVFIFTEIDGVPPREICNNLGISPTNYRVILYRARLALRRCMEQHGFGPNGEL